MVMVAVGRVGRPIGLRGEVAVSPLTDVPEQRFVVGAMLLAGDASSEPLEIATVRQHAGRPAISFVGHDNRDAAAALTGTLLMVDVDQTAVPAETDEYFDVALHGLAAVDTAGRQLGTVIEVEHRPGSDYLLVEVPDSEPVLVPFVKEIVTEVDLARCRVVIDPPRGLSADWDSLL